MCRDVKRELVLAREYFVLACDDNAFAHIFAQNTQDLLQIKNHY